MATTKVTFESVRGHSLSGSLESGPEPVRAYALFAHCFTCNKTSLAATRVSRALANRGVAVLRFDFSGLGNSEGEFGNGLSADVQDINAACRAMESDGKAVQLLIGHSFGGAAVLEAAHDLPTVRAVATIGAPFHAGHVLKHARRDKPEMSDRSAVTVGERTLHLSDAFMADAEQHDPSVRIANLRRALLVLHSPIDSVVSVENASQIFLAARHPKSFVSLDQADHLLLQTEDAGYVASCIDAWSRRYLG